MIRTLGLLVSLTLIGASMSQAADKPERVLRHVVIFKFKADVTPEQIREVETAFRALPKKIDAIHDFEWGTDVSPEKLSKGFTHCFFVTFRDEKGRDEYLPHPAHKQFVDLVKPRLDDVFVIDYWSR